VLGHDLDFTVNLLGLRDTNNLFSFHPPRSDALFSNAFEDLFIFISDSIDRHSYSVRVIGIV